MQSHQIAEFTGNYGPVSIPEKLIQRLWLERAPGLNNLNTSSGFPIQVIHPGQWNPLDGPDFLNAHLVIGNEQFHGDIEVHFHEQDWRHHKHDHDARYQRVILHVVLFPETTTARAPCQVPEHRLVLLDFLDKDLESLAEIDYLEQSMRSPLRTPPPEGWASLHARQRRIQLIHHASVRFYRMTRKINRLRKTVGWQATCHQTALEILGLPGNRDVLRKLAEQYPLAQFRDLALNRIWEDIQPYCRIRGIRPVNHPLNRLRFYHQFLQQHPTWPEILREVVIPEFTLSPEDFARPGGISKFRSRSRLRQVSQSLQSQTGWQPLGAGKWNTLVVNLILPLLSTNTATQLWPWWFAWHPANRPDSFNVWLKTWEITQSPAFPHCNGWDQGVLALQTGSAG